MQLDRVQIHQRRHVGEGPERRIAEHADRQHAGLARKSGQRRGFLCRDVAGAAWHEHEAGECRWPGGAKIGTAIQSA